MSNPIIFLDIDGVLVTQNSINRFKNSHTFDPNCVDVLNWFISQTNADIVISSDWRLFMTLRGMDYGFKQMGIVGRVIGFTPDFSNDNKSRIDEINSVIDDAKIDRFVVIDDYPFTTNDFRLRNSMWVVNTNFNTGLNDRNMLSFIIRRIIGI